jgi:large repetitive protein
VVLRGRSARAGARAAAPLALAVALVALALCAAPALAEAPRVFELDAPYGPPAGGNAVSISGPGVGAATAVAFGSTPAGSFTVVSEREIRATAPAGTGTVYVTVTTPEGTSSASAEQARYVYTHTPEFGTCERGPVSGWFGTAGCQTGLDGEVERYGYSWYPGFGGPDPLVPGQRDVTLSSGKPLKLETVGKHSVTCTGASAAGEVSGLSTIAIERVTLTGCSAGSLGPCQSVEAAAGEIRTNALAGQLGETSVNETLPAKDKVGIELRAAEGDALAGFRCGVAPASLRGSVILAFATPGKMRSKFTLTGADKRGVQKIARFVGGPEAVLEMALGDEAPYERAGVKAKATLEIPDLVEVNTVA